MTEIDVIERIGPAASIASRLRRARRNGTGLRIDATDLQTLAQLGIYEILARAEAEEMCLAKANTATAISGSTSDETDDRPTSGRSPTIPRNRAPLSIAALAADL